MDELKSCVYSESQLKNITKYTTLFDYHLENILTNVLYNTSKSFCNWTWTMFTNSLQYKNCYVNHFCLIFLATMEPHSSQVIELLPGTIFYNISSFRRFDACNMVCTHLMRPFSRKNYWVWTGSRLLHQTRLSYVLGTCTYNDGQRCGILLCTWEIKI